MVYRIVNALKSISNAFWNIANAFQRKRFAMQILCVAQRQHFNIISFETRYPFRKDYCIFFDLISEKTVNVLGD